MPTILEQIEACIRSEARLLFALAEAATEAPNQTPILRLAYAKAIRESSARLKNYEARRARELSRQEGLDTIH